MVEAHDPTPWRDKGKRLGYAVELATLDEWPPKTMPGKRRDRDSRSATAYLLIPAFEGDGGARPLPGTESVHSGGVWLIDGNGAVTTTPSPGREYRLAASVKNLGATTSYAGLIDFFVASPVALDAAATGGPPPPAFASTGFTLQPQGTLTIFTTKTWTPANAAEAQLTLLARVYDFVLDPLGNGFDARGSRHVARRDAVLDFSGVWDGNYTPDGRSNDKLRVIITQAGTTAQCQFFAQVGGVLPNTPQSTGSGQVVGTQLTLLTTDHLMPNIPFTTNQWTLSLPDFATLHIENIHTFPAGDGRPTQHWVGDLQRI
jgi:hypothetical protein